jgi:hypothetical protein
MDEIRMNRSKEPGLLRKWPNYRGKEMEMKKTRTRLEQMRRAYDTIPLDGNASTRLIGGNGADNAELGPPPRGYQLDTDALARLIGGGGDNESEYPSPVGPPPRGYQLDTDALARLTGGNGSNNPEYPDPVGPPPRFRQNWAE